MLPSLVWNVFYLRSRGKLRAALQFAGAWLRELVWTGLPLFLWGDVHGFFASLDRLAIGKLLGLAELGVYTIATLAANYVFMAPNMLKTVIYPRVLEKFGS